MHITSLPEKYGIGTMGKQAYAFIDFLKEAGQSVWQILPLNPTGYGDSPYQSCSTFAGNYYLIDLQDLIDRDLLTLEEVESVDWGESEDRVDFGKQFNAKLKVLRYAYDRFEESEEFTSFCKKNSNWLSDYSLFMAIKQEVNGKPWYEWEDGLRNRDPDAIWKARSEMRDIIRFQNFVQFLFYSQWEKLHKYATQNGIEILGDVPIYVPRDSVDVWANPELFQMDENKNPTVVAGCPPDFFSEDGQLWGNPIYRWEDMQEDRFSWWIRRLRAASGLYDIIRLDHFRGFEAYWAVPAEDETARNGEWVPGPGMAFFRVVQEELPNLKLIAEDLGFLTPGVVKMKDESGYPGMKIVQFGFDDRDSDTYIPYAYPSNSVCYVGTHDNMTLQQWLDTASESTLEYAKEYMFLNEQEGFTWGVIRTAMSSPSDLCIIQMQDYLGLGEEARMNFPGTLSANNWTWRADENFANVVLAEKIYKMTRLYGRTKEKAIVTKEIKGEIKDEV